jgi:ribonuclease D
MTTGHRWIDRPEQVPEVAQALATAAWIGLDTEANSMFVYREQMCLLQLNIAGELWLIDVLALLQAENWPGLQPTGEAAPVSNALAALRSELARTDRTLWLHGGEYDCALLRRDFGITLGGVWDTQQAGAFLGWEKTNYGALVERCTQVVLAKGHAQYDWGTRPIDAEALQYAIDDVVHLPAVGAFLRAAIAEADLVEEHAIACSAVSGTVTEGGVFDPAGFWRIKGVREVSVHLARWHCPQREQTPRSDGEQRILAGLSAPGTHQFPAAQAQWPQELAAVCAWRPLAGSHQGGSHGA